MKLQFVIFVIFVTSCLYSREVETLFDPISSYLKMYRQHIETEDLTYNNGVINLALDGRRTNHKSLLLLGFHALGKQLQKHTFPIRDVQIIIYYEMKNTREMVYISSVKSVLALAQGQKDPNQFFNELRY